MTTSSPSFAARFSGWQQNRLPAALRMLGFAHVAETAEGAAQVSLRSLEQNRDSAAICTACPVIVTFCSRSVQSSMLKMQVMIFIVLPGMLLSSALRS